MMENMDVDESTDKLQIWYPQLAQFLSESTNDVRVQSLERWIEEVVLECIMLLKFNEEIDVIGPYLEFLANLYTHEVCVYLTFKSDIGPRLFPVFKKILTSRKCKGLLQTKTISVLTSILKTTREFKDAGFKNNPSRQNVFDLIPLFIMQSDVDHFASNCLSTTDLTLLNAVVAFLQSLTSVTEFAFQRILPIFETSLMVFNLVLNDPVLDQARVLQFLQYIAKNSKDMSKNYQQQIVRFVTKVISSRYWKSSQKIECIQVLEICQNMHPEGNYKIGWRMSSLFYFMQNTVADLEYVEFLTFLINADFKLSTLVIPELEDISKPANPVQLINLFQNLSFNLQNLLIKAMNPEQESYVWMALHELMEYLLRRCNLDLDDETSAKLLKDVTIHSSMTFTIRNIILRGIPPEQSSKAVLKFLKSWTESLRLMAFSGRPLQLDMFTRRSGFMTASGSYTILTKELNKWLEAQLHGQPNPGVGIRTKKVLKKRLEEQSLGKAKPVGIRNEQTEIDEMRMYTSKRKYLIDILKPLRRIMKSLGNAEDTTDPNAYWSDDDKI